MVFSSSHVWMWELDYKEIWVQKNWCFWTVVLEKTLESLLDCKEIQPVHPKENQSWIFTRRTDAEAETPILWPPDAKNWLISKDPVAGKDWRREEKGTTEDDMVGWHHRLNGHEFEQILSHLCYHILSYTHISSVQLSRSVVSDSLRPHELQYARPPCPSPTPRVTQTHVHWIGDAIQPSHPLLSPSPPSFNLPQYQGVF